jgi:hypothetical protein
MKIKNLIAGLFLSSIMGVGVVTGVTLNSVSNVKEAEAADPVYSLSGDFNSWGDLDMTDPDKDGIYTATTNLQASTGLKVRVNHAWGTSYGTKNVFWHTPEAFADGDDDGNIWCQTAGQYTFYFNSSSKRIDILKSTASYPTTYKTFYLIVNWNDWSNPRLHYWSTEIATNWNCIPSFVNKNRQYTGGGETGPLYSIDIPNEISSVIVTKSDLSKQTTTLGLTSSINAANFYYESADKLRGFELTLVDDGAYLRGDWANGWSISGQKAMSSSSSSGPYSIIGVNLSAGSAVKSLYMTGGVEQWCQFKGVSSTDPVHYPVKKVDDGMGGYNAAVVSSGTYNITVTNDGEGWNYVFTGTANTDLDAAISFANTFISTMEANCPATSQGGSSQKVANAWSGQITVYSGLSGDVQYYLLDEDSSITAITNFFSSYDYIYGHYASVRALQGANFLGRTIPVSANYSVALIGSNSNSTNAIVIVVVISVVGLSAIGGYFFLRKRKQD